MTPRALKTLTLACVLLVAPAWVRAESEGPLAACVVVLANASSEASLKLARHYVKRRGIPVENIVALPMTTAETINWREFIDTIYQPAQDELMKRGWIEGAAGVLKDKLGRRKVAIASHRISYLVTCLGVPLRIDHDPALYEETKPYTMVAAFRTNSGAVDAELAALTRGGYAINAYLPNPLFQKERPTVVDLLNVVKVSRLDGPTLEQAMALVDQAIAAEKTGLIGRAYVDSGGPHPEGDGWMKQTATMLDELGFDLTTETTSETFGAGARFDAPALYFGWYAGDVNGPFARTGFRFPPGAVALHLHSFSATTVRSPMQGWCGPLIARGATATFGNVYEPYLTFTHQPHLLLRALAKGETLGDAAFYALRGLSWQEVVIGDPLYRPFAIGFAEQWAARATLSDERFPYVILREVRRLQSAGQAEQAINVLREARAARAPRLVLTGKLIELLVLTGKADEAAAVFAGAARVTIAGPDDAAVAREMIEAVKSSAPSGPIVEAYGDWLAREGVVDDLRLRLLRAGAAAAEKLNHAERAAQWRREAEKLGKAAR